MSSKKFFTISLITTIVVVFSMFFVIHHYYGNNEIIIIKQQINNPAYIKKTNETNIQGTDSTTQGHPPSEAPVLSQPSTLKVETSVHDMNGSTPTQGFTTEESVQSNKMNSTPEPVASGSLPNEANTEPAKKNSTKENTTNIAQKQIPSNTKSTSPETAKKNNEIPKKSPQSISKKPPVKKPSSIPLQKTTSPSTVQKTTTPSTVSSHPPLNPIQPQPVSTTH
jgi:hypothetical protein